MFLDEARIAASLDHPNIAQVTDIDSVRGEYFLAMEYVHGRNLREVLKRAPEGLPLGLALVVLIGVCAGLHHAHEALGNDGRPLGLVHRDVSPSNVMVAYSGAIKLTDFGIAKAAARTSKTLAGRIKGKIGYMSPEQCRGEEVDRRSDIFSLGIVAYEVLTGARAFHAPNEFAAMARTARGDFSPPQQLRPELPPALVRIVERALATDPDARYPTALAMQLELEAFAEADGRTLSTVELAEFMRESFGAPPHPQTLSVPHVAADDGMTVRAVPPAQPPAIGRGRFWLAIAAASSITAVTVYAVTRPHDAEAARTDTAAPTRAEDRPREAGEMSAGDAAQPAVATTPVSATPGAAAPAPTATAAPTPASAAAPSPTAAAATPTDARSTSTREPARAPARRRARGGTKPAPASTSAPSTPPASLYPPGYER
ncbi:MAG: serine/threonine-protein kinase [Nannocystaceae bacterium]